MALSQLNVRAVRNLREVTLEPGLGINLFHGPNASGKTSLLEAIHILGRGESFRSHDLKKVVSFDQAYLRITGQLAGDGRRMGVEYGPEGLVMRVAGQTVASRVELMRALPVITITPESHRLLSEGPRWRRRMLDWGVFHVEPGFLPTWRRYQRAIKQRNAALRTQNKKLTSTWDAALSAAAMELDGYRRAYLQRLCPYLTAYGRQLVAVDGLRTDYYPGWKRGEVYEESLRSMVEQDLGLGYTRQGPHRADLTLLVGEGRRARDVVSRGQQKLLVAALLLAQITVIKETNAARCVALVDDLAAELDSEHRQRFLLLLNELDIQTFVTATDTAAVPMPSELRHPPSWFHVEQGRIGPF